MDYITQAPLPLGFRLHLISESARRKTSGYLFFHLSGHSLLMAALLSLRPQLLKGNPSSTAGALGVTMTLYSFFKPDHIFVNGLFIKLYCPFDDAFCLLGGGRVGIQTASVSLSAFLRGYNSRDYFIALEGSGRKCLREAKNMALGFLVYLFVS